MSFQNLVIANDHAGLDLKIKIMDYFSNQKIKNNLYKNISITDFGTNTKDKVDYPDYAKIVVDEVIEENADCGILICKTGIGMSIAANRHRDIRAALCTNVRMAQYARLHNDANILVFGSSIVNEKLVYRMIDTFLSTSFEGGYHIKRLNKIC